MRLERTLRYQGPRYSQPRIKGFVETSFVDWEGRISGVLFVGGCNFRCPFCHNPDLVTGTRKLSDIPLDQILKKLKSLRGWLDGVCISGGEPTLKVGLVHVIREIRSLGYEVKLYTNGSRPQMISRLLEEGLVNFFSMDIKAPLREGAYKRCCGVSPPLKRIAQSLLLLGRDTTRCEFRTTLVPGLLHPTDIIEIASFLPKGSKYIVQSFRPGRTLNPSLSHIKPPPNELIEVLQKQVEERLMFKEKGQDLQVVRLGEHIQRLDPNQSVRKFLLKDGSIPGKARRVTGHVYNGLGLEEA